VGFKVKDLFLRIWYEGYKLCRWPPSVQSNQKRNFEKANIEYRIMNIECRINECCLFYKKRLSEANPPFDIRHLTFDILRFAFIIVSFKAFLALHPEKVPPAGQQ
jgi:hypothetical protein